MVTIHSANRVAESRCVLCRLLIAMVITALAVSDWCSAQEAQLFQLRDLTVSEIQKRAEAGSLTATELTQYYLDRITALDDAGPQLNALLQINPDALKSAAALDEERIRQGPRGPCTASRS